MTDSQKTKRKQWLIDPKCKDWQAHRKGNPVPSGLWFSMPSNHLQRLLQSKSRWKTSLQWG